jgi:CheY-like chemotaxis protein
MRPNLMVIEIPDAERVSTRKLVLEAAKFNVLTATSAQEAIAMLTRLDLDGVILPLHLEGTTCRELAEQLRDIRPGVKILAPRDSDCDDLVTYYPHFDPASLVHLCRQLFGDPLATERKEQAELSK